ncbi:TraM recognition domain-containing protein [Kineosporia sp. NBRC 101677]|uniref:TraM recognition domain-containing protein n=1 Tax=Kineosporia sp. NBRC 101677 TaxID=3032197 RepID=UPI0025576954|nr:TraM recognition domain-containing protein [Kineosporia sp. NBRC 101677]
MSDAWRLLLKGGLTAVWPSLAPALVLFPASFVAVGLMVAIVAVALRWVATHPRRDGFAGAGQFAELLPGRAGWSKARRLRSGLPGLRVRELPDADRGVPLGRIGQRGGILRATWEDVILAICAPRSGKTTCLAVPAVLDAPGPVLATSNKADLWTYTAGLRAEDTGEQVWTFDPQGITRRPQSFVWNALDGVSTVADARRLAGHFIQEVRRTKDAGDFWDRDAEDLLTGLLLAAALGGFSLTQVGAWLTSTSSVQPRNILAEHGFAQLADVMTGRSQGAVETREGVYATARAAAACLSDPAIMAWVTPSPGLALFNPARFAVSRQTLYLLSKDGAGSAAPLVAAFADRVMLEAVAAAELAPGGRLDPPMVAVLDEAANVCRITELPRLYSHLGSRGVVPLTILQSRSQGQRVWGEGGMAELFGAATIKLIGAGVDEQGFAEELSKLVGEEDVLVTTRSSGGSGGTSRSSRRERVLPADEVRALPKFTALLLATGIRPALVRLVPWMAGAHAERIRSAVEDSA